MLEQTLQHVDRRAERRHRRAVLDLAVPAAVRELLTEEPVNESLDVLAEVRAGRDDVAVDARLDLAVEEPVVVPWGIHRGAALPGDALADATDCPPGLITLGIEPQPTQELQSVKSVRPVVRPGPATPLAIRRLERQQPRAPALRRDPRPLCGDDVRLLMRQITHHLPADRGIGRYRPSRSHPAC